ncbi:hypothetical protein EG831_11905, partial [bacterium]|nr:hypothetical protein [bacterium]
GAIRWRLPDTAAAGQGWVKLYVKDGARDWCAAARLAIGQTAFTAYRATPPRPSDLDSIGISAAVYAEGGVDPDSVHCQWKFGPAGDTVGGLQQTAMVVATGDTFALAQRISPSPWYNQYLNYRIGLADSGTVSYGGFQRCRIWTRPDLVPGAEPRDTRLGGRRRLALLTTLRNAGETDAVNVPVAAFTADGDSLFATAMVDTLKAGASRTVEFPYPLGAGQHDVYFIADPAHATAPPEQDTSNNRSSVHRVPPEHLEYHQLNATGGSGGTVVDFGGAFRWALADSSLPDSAVAMIERIEVGPASPLRPGRQPGLRMIGDSVQQAYAVSFTDSALALAGARRLWAAVRNPALDTAAASG